MALKDNLLATAEKMITEYGSDITLSKKITASPIYNPVTDEFDGVDESISLSTKGVPSKLEEGDDGLANIESVKQVWLIKYDEDVSGIDNTWMCNNNKIYYVKITSVQNQPILYRLYIG